MAFSYSNSEQLPFPSTLNAANFAPTKLWFDYTGTNYEAWKEQMICLIQSQGLLAFIDGTKEQPSRLPETDQEYYQWRRTDTLLRGWILCSLTDDVVYRVRALKTSRDVWLELQKNFQPYFNLPPPIWDPTVETGRDHAQEDLDYLPLLRAALQGEWEEAKKVLDHHPGSGINHMRRNALHAAASTGKGNLMVKELIVEMPNEFITPVDGYGDTALTVAASVGNTELVSYLADKMPNLLYIPNKYGDFPVQVAALYAERRALHFLIDATKSYFNDRANPYTGSAGLRLLIYVIDAEFLDIALWLVEQYPGLARLTRSDGSSALKKISSKKSIFHSARRFSNWERFISSCIVQPDRADTTFTPQFPNYYDMESVTQNTQSGAIGIKKTTMLKKQALKLVKLLCTEIESLGYERAKGIYFDACVVATELGIHEVVEEIVRVFPNAIYCTTPETKQFLFHVAVKNRSEQIYHLIRGLGDHVRLFSTVQDSNGNNLLHLAGKLAPSHKLDEISGAALQMLHELQWYKEVENFVNPHSREQLNNAGKSPKTVFTEEHQALKEAGEKWAKDTANSCTIVAALIATVMFAAAITVPGGTDGTRGFPIFSNSTAFIVFAVSDAISLFACTTSLLMFLAILTSRYAEHDFLYDLPKRLIIGLVTLFVSITFMMVAFSATIYLVFGRMNAWVLIPVGGLACFQVISFAHLQFPLLFALISGSGRFDKHRRTSASSLSHGKSLHASLPEGRSSNCMEFISFRITG